MLNLLWIVVAAIVILLILFKALRLKRVTVYEYQKGLRYDKGRYAGTLGPGQYRIFSASSSIVAVDVRKEFISVLGQDVVSADGVTLKVSLAAEFQIADPNLAINSNTNFRTSLYLSLQMALREIVSQQKVDFLLENRTEINTKLMELSSPKASELGLALLSAGVKDIMIPGEMKKVFAQVVKAQKEGQAALEKARSETAALRSLANAARMMEDNPSLLQLRALQTMVDSSGNTLVLGLQNSPIPLSKGNRENAAPPAKPNRED